MKMGLPLAGLILIFAMTALAKDPSGYDTGLLLSMNSSTCGTTEKGGKTVAGEVLGTDSEHKHTEQVLCQEYVLQGNRLVYHIRPTDIKHPKLLPVGESVQYRIHKDKMYVLDREGEAKEREYTVISMQARLDVNRRDGQNQQ